MVFVSQTKEQRFSVAYLETTFHSIWEVKLCGDLRQAASENLLERDDRCMNDDGGECSGGPGSQSWPSFELWVKSVTNMRSKVREITHILLALPVVRR